MSTISFGLGQARVLVELTRQDGSVDTVEIFKVRLDDTENGFTVSETYPETAFIDRIDAVTLPPEREISIQIEGQLLADDNGQMYTIKQGDS